MSDGFLLGGRAELEALFEELAVELEAEGATLDVLVLGGSWMLWFDEAEFVNGVIADAAG